MNHPKREIDNFGTIRYYNEKGELHCTDGPAEIFKNGTLRYYQNNQLHNENGPAEIFPDGTKVYWKNGRIHNENGPACIYPNGQQEFYYNGLLHNLNGTAIIHPDGTKEYYILSHKFNESDFQTLQIQINKFIDNQITNYKKKLVESILSN